MSLYTELSEAGQKIDNHYSDLYVKLTPESHRIVLNSGISFSLFKSQIDESTWIECPFMFDPFWEKKANGH